jgi:hypothetical protein
MRVISRNYLEIMINQVLGKYDQYHDVYVLNVKMNNNPNDYVTWVYSDEGDNNGWLLHLIQRICVE